MNIERQPVVEGFNDCFQFVADKPADQWHDALENPEINGDFKNVFLREEPGCPKPDGNRKTIHG